MEVICLEETAFFTLVEEVIIRMREKYSGEKPKWIATEEAMELLSIKSKTTLQQLRDMGKIRFSQPQKRVILYDRESILQYLDKNAKNTF